MYDVLNNKLTLVIFLYMLVPVLVTFAYTSAKKNKGQVPHGLFFFFVGLIPASRAFMLWANQYAQGNSFLILIGLLTILIGVMCLLVLLAFLRYKTENHEFVQYRGQEKRHRWKIVSQALLAVALILTILTFLEVEWPLIWQPLMPEGA